MNFQARIEFVLVRSNDIAVINSRITLLQFYQICPLSRQWPSRPQVLFHLIYNFHNSDQYVRPIVALFSLAVLPDSWSNDRNDILPWLTIKLLKFDGQNDWWKIIRLFFHSFFFFSNFPNFKSLNLNYTWTLRSLVILRLPSFQVDFEIENIQELGRHDRESKGIFKGSIRWNRFSVDS